ncbi:MBL fold metallo-hydrolase [bacterium]|nr:MBL fold metallo-hydrolase [bacterium]
MAKHDDDRVPDSLTRSARPRKAREIAPGIHFLAGFGNTTFVVGREAVAVVDPGLFASGPRVVEELRGITDLPVRWVIYTHGHYDHAFGTPALLEDAEARGHAAPGIVGHVNVARRFARYAKTAGHLAKTFDFQFASWGPGGGDVVRRARYCPPTVEFTDAITLDGLGGRPIECRHGLGETDDHAWVWVPDARVVVGGDFIVSSLPNAGTPFRVQRYVLEWAEALEAMAAVSPLAVVSGHGGVYTEDATEMLATTARALRWLDAEVVRRINEGQWQEQILAEVELPADLAGSPYLQPLYGCTAFAVRDLLRRYMGWYDGNPSMLFPSTRASIAREVVDLAGGVDAILRRADELARGGAAEQQRALHLVDFAIHDGREKVAEARRRKADLLEARASGERSFVAGNVLRSAAVLEREAVGKA